MVHKDSLSLLMLLCNQDSFQKPGDTNKRLPGMCRWMGSHFHDWTDYHGVAFSIVEWGGTCSEFWGKTVLHNLQLANIPKCLCCR